MLYYLAKYLSRIASWVFFKKVYFSNQEAIPKNKVLIFAANHPTAFIEPSLVTALSKIVFHFIVRGDVFVGNLVLKLLAGLHMYPIFRFRDGYTEMKKNAELMEKLYGFLNEGKHLFILAEGETKHEKRLRPIQKGAARLAFGAIERYGVLDIEVVPLGVNYTDSDRFRSEVMMTIGKAIPLADYFPVYKENPRKAIKQLTDEIERRLRPLVVHVEEKKYDALANTWLEIHRNNQLTLASSLNRRSNEKLERELETVHQFNAFSDAEKEDLEQRVSGYEKALQQNQSSDQGIAKKAVYNWKNTLILILGAPIFLLGYLLNALPLIGAVNFANKKAKKIEFHSSVRFGVGLAGYFIYWLILLLIGGISFGWLGLGLVVCIPLLGFIALWYRDLWQVWREARIFVSLKEKEKNDLIEQRNAILTFTSSK